MDKNKPLHPCTAKPNFSIFAEPDNGVFAKRPQKMENVKNKIKLAPPGGVSRIVLHSCCAPCSSAIIEALLYNGITPLIYYCNPNIYPYDEYRRRKDEITAYARRLGLEIEDGDYDHDRWLASAISQPGREDEPERGARCLDCFTHRLLQTARFTRQKGYGVFTTTLASSRWKDINQICAAGRAAASSVGGVIFWEQNWRRGGLYERRNYLLKEEKFYNQQYCGCEFSLRNMERHRNEAAARRGSGNGTAPNPSCDGECGKPAAG